MPVSSTRVRAVNDAPIAPGGRYVLYWMIAARRTRANLALERAADLAAELAVGLWIVEPLRAGYRWASDRLHGFVIDGMRDNQRALEGAGVGYWPYLEPEPGAGRGLLEALAADACAVVTDDYPCFFLPAMVEAAGERLAVRLEMVDGNGLYPMRDTERVFTTAASFRRHLQKQLPAHLGERAALRPLEGRALPPPPELPAAVAARWPPADLACDNRALLSSLPIDHSVAETGARGGSAAADAVLEAFLDGTLDRYGVARNDPDDDAQSHLSPYLHFGHIGAQEVFDAVVDRESWTPDRLAPSATGSRAGWWGMGEAAEAFLDELITWREIGFNMCANRGDYDRIESLPPWARATIAAHADDPREHVYDDDDFAAARTHDPLWNAAQNQLVREGFIHNYLRMLWGKKIYEWTASAADAVRVMVELNNRYALDGRDPNSYSGIFWVVGRYDRAWGPERPIFGKLRYMSSASAARKLRLTQYLARYRPS